MDENKKVQELNIVQENNQKLLLLSEYICINGGRIQQS